MNISAEIEKYKKVFDIPIPVYHQIDERNEQRLVFSGYQAALLITADSLPVIPQFMAQIKMGLLYHPLLATFYFQKNLSNKERKYARAFHSLTEPLIDIWTVQIQSKYMGKLAFARELDLLNLMAEDLLSGKQDNITTSDFLSVYLCTKTFMDADLKIDMPVKEGENQDVFNNYVSFLESAAKREPNVDDILQLPVIAQVPYVVKIKNKPYIHFVIKENTPPLGVGIRGNKND